MNGALVAKAGGLAFATVMAVSPSSCQSLSTSSSTSSSPTSDRTRVVVKADGDSCWTVTIDGTDHDGCGGKTFDLSGSSHSAQLVRTKGHGGITLTIVSNGRTVSSTTVRSWARSTNASESHR